VDGKGADWEAFGVTLVVDPDCYQHYVCVQSRDLFTFHTPQPIP